LATFQLGLESAGEAGYLLGLFFYVIAATVALPIPLEILLSLSQIDTSVKAVVVGLGKAVGAIFVFYVGSKVNRLLERWMSRHPSGARVLKALEGFVRKTKWVGLTILLAIPFMSDTAVNYFYSLMNEEGQAIGRRYFVLANFIGGVVRTYLYLWLLPLLLAWLLPP
jgi:uncharacterized membrane protein YdjX (TVP38/TMEM64 family)